jgi:hypothetical protein
MSSFAQIIELLRSISFGALLANCLLFMVFVRHPNLFPANMTPKELFFIGTAFGTLLHRSINSVIFNPLTRSLASSLAFYSKLIELAINRNKGLLTKDEYSRFSSELKAQYFGSQGSTQNATKAQVEDKISEAKPLTETTSERAFVSSASASRSAPRKGKRKKAVASEDEDNSSPVDDETSGV